VFLFGDYDWMYAATGGPLKKKLDEMSDMGKCHGIDIIENCGHQVPLENADNTTKMMLKYYRIFKSEDAKILDENNELFTISEDEIPSEPQINHVY